MKVRPDILAWTSSFTGSEISSPFFTRLTKWVPSRPIFWNWNEPNPLPASNCSSGLGWFPFCLLCGFVAVAGNKPMGGSSILQSPAQAFSIETPHGTLVLNFHLLQHCLKQFNAQETQRLTLRLPCKCISLECWSTKQLWYIQLPLFNQRKTSID